MKQRLLFMVGVLCCVAMALVGCGGTVLTGEMAEDGSSYTITADSTDEGDMVMSGTLIVGEGDQITVDHQMEGDGVLTVKLIPASDADEDASVDELTEDMDAGNAALEITIEGGGLDSYTAPAGEYMVYVEASKGATGTATITVEAGEPFSDWKTADSAETAAKAAGLDGFSVPEGIEISLGEIKASAYKCKGKVAMAEIPFPAVQMYIIKGVDESGDVSCDPEEYANTWTQNIKGLEVNCFGNREGDATKTIWTVDGVSYAIVAYGLGGDDSYGLSADDLNSIINGLQ